MKSSGRPPRTASRLSDTIHCQLNSYALAASAAGVGVLALAQPVEAKIVYHKTYLVIAGAERYNLDLNHDRITDFSVVNFFTTACPDSCVQALYLIPAGGNSEVGSTQRNFHFAAAMKKGSAIGPKAHFLAGSAVMREAFSTQGSAGPWNNVNNRYLGFKFQIKGKTHYGWARLNVTGGGLGTIVATMTGYAYETIPNKAIVAGRTKGTEDGENRFGTLGGLALGRK
jgi:hypothetical protein